MISWSTKGRSRANLSMRVTRTPRAANMHAYSRPMTPHPTTARVLGSSSISRMSSLTKIERPSKGMCGSRMVVVPTARTIFSARHSWRSPLLPEVLEAAGVWGSTKEAWADQDLDVVPLELVPGHVHLVADDLLHAGQQVVHGDLPLHGVGGAVDAALAVAREAQHGLAQGLAGDGPGVQADPAHHRPPLHDGHALLELGRLDGGPVAGGAGADHEKVVVVFGHGVSRARGPSATGLRLRPSPRRSAGPQLPATAAGREGGAIVDEVEAVGPEDHPTSWASRHSSPARRSVEPLDEVRERPDPEFRRRPPRNVGLR